MNVPLSQSHPPYYRSISKQFLRYFLSLSALILGIAFLLYLNQASVERLATKKREKTTVSFNLEKISGEFDTVVSDLMVLSENGNLRLFLATGDRAHLKQLSREFLTFSKRKKIYDQIRFLDHRGMEIIRVNFNSGAPDLVGKKLLQDKGRRYYFNDTFFLQKGEVYVSPFDLNIENGEIEKPLKPMIRFGTPVFDDDGKKQGIVLLNYLGAKLIGKLDYEHKGSRTYLLNADGFWLKGPNREDEWGFMHENGCDNRINNAYPKIWEIMTTSNSGQILVPEGLFTYATICPFSEAMRSSTGSGRPYKASSAQLSGKEYKWKVLSHVPKIFFNESDRKIRHLILLLVLPMIGVLAAGSWYFALANFRRKVAELALRESHTNLEKRVDLRTREVRRANAQLELRIDEIKKTKEALAESEHYYRSLINDLHEEIYVIGPDHKISDINDTVLASSGINRGNIIGSRCHEILHRYDTPCDQHGEQCLLLKVFKTGRPQICNHKHYDRDGKTIWVSIVYSPLKDRNQKTTHVIEVSRNITDLKQTEFALRESEEKYRLLVENADDAIFIVQDGAVKFFNCMTKKLFGCTEEELAAKHIVDLIHEEDRDRILDRIRGETITKDIPDDASFRIINNKRQEIWVELNMAIVSWEGRPATLLFLRDLTVKRALEKQLRQAQKMEAIGTLAGGIAHDFNNILAAMVGYTELAKDQLADEEKAKSHLGQVIMAGNRAKALVRQILTFSRQREQKTEPVEVHLIVKETLKFLRATIPMSIQITQKLDSESGYALADPTQIHQVVMNLCANAYHAMREKGGELAVTLKAVAVRKEAVADKPHVKPGPYLELMVKDTGCGMDQRTLERLFEPYFTTKEKEEGTGMGLSVTHGIIKSYNGFITVSSQPGKGATFRAYLPKITTRHALTSAENDTLIPRGSEHILLVDDEDPIARMLQQSLEGLGYKVSPFTSSAEALEYFHHHAVNIDLVVTDLSMPKMTGIQLSQNFLEIRPDIPIILCTGYSEEFAEREARELGIKALVFKPFNKKEIAGTIRNVLGYALE